jgi:hypothetical protein
MASLCAISLAGTSLSTGKLQFRCCICRPKLTGLWHLGCIEAKHNAMAHPKMDSRKQIIWQLWAAKMRRQCDKCRRRARRRSFVVVKMIRVQGPYVPICYVPIHFIPVRYVPICYFPRSRMYVRVSTNRTPPTYQLVGHLA